jgi:hypothetical protein
VDLGRCDVMDQQADAGGSFRSLESWLFSFYTAARMPRKSHCRNVFPHKPWLSGSLMQEPEVSGTEV